MPRPCDKVCSRNNNPILICLLRLCVLDYHITNAAWEGNAETYWISCCLRRINTAKLYAEQKDSKEFIHGIKWKKNIYSSKLLLTEKSTDFIWGINAHNILCQFIFSSFHFLKNEKISEFKIATITVSIMKLMIVFFSFLSTQNKHFSLETVVVFKHEVTYS